MIHQGDSPVAGHYKLCVRVAADQWIEYNDRKVSTVGESIIQKYKDKGEISCLFYRRSSLVCSEPTGTLSYNLKTTVTQEEKAIMRQID